MWARPAHGLQVCACKRQVRAEDKQGPTEACINLQGHANEMLGADPSKNRPVWTGMSMNATFNTRKKKKIGNSRILLYNISWHDATPTCRQRRRAVELLKSLFQFVCLFALNKGFETVELLHHRDGLTPAGYAAQKTIQCLRQRMKLVHLHRAWRST